MFAGVCSRSRGRVFDDTGSVDPVRAAIQALPTFPGGTLPDFVAYEALNVRGLAAGASYVDPVSRATVYKMTDASSPSAGNTFGALQYSSGAPSVSHRWMNGSTAMRTMLCSDSNGVYLVDFEELTGVRSNVRPGPWLARELQAGFSFNPATPQILYYLKNVLLGGENDTRHIARYDTALNADAPLGHFPKDLTGVMTGQDLTWLTFDQSDRFFACSVVATNEVTCWDSVQDRAFSQVFTDLDEPHLSADGSALLVDYNLTSAIVRTADFVVTHNPTTHGQFSHPAGSRGGYFGQSGMGGDGSGVVYYDAAADADVAVPALSSRALTGAFVDCHRSANWVQANADPTTDYLFNVSEQSSLFSNGSWALVSGHIYQATGILGMGVSAAIDAVFQKNAAGTSLTQQLTRVANAGLIVAPGQWSYVGTTLTVWPFQESGVNLDLTNPTSAAKVHFYGAAGLGPYGMGFYPLGGGVTDHAARFVCHHYSSVWTGVYGEQAFGTIASPDGRFVGFHSTMNLEGGRTDVFLVRVA